MRVPIAANVDIDSDGIRAILTALNLEAVIEPLLPDTQDRPAKWWAEDIARAIREKAA
jgi:hypothetical protein